MPHYTKKDIIRMIEDEDVEFIRLQFTDIFGTLKNVAVTASQIERIIDNGAMFDASAIEGFTQIEESDMFLYPDLDTFVTFPWRPQQGKVARMICDVYRPDGEPFEGDSRYILKKAIAEAQSMGYTLDVGPELEFFLFHTDEEGMPTTITREKGGYFDLGSLDMGENARRDTVMTLEEMGYEVEASHHEAAPGQHEIDFRYTDALSAADNIMTFKLVIKAMAQRHGLYASFMPKPLTGSAGSGMHINMSLNNRQGINIFNDPSDPMGMSPEAYYFVGGMIRHAGGMNLITNPIVNSYKRLVPGYEAPCHAAWSASNRSPMIRIPSTRGSGRRIELRTPDPAANPYLTLALALTAGLAGIREKQLPPSPISGNIFRMTEAQQQAAGIAKLPSDLMEAVKGLEADETMKAALGPHITEKYLETKRREWEDYRRAVSQWEIDQYLYKI